MKMQPQFPPGQLFCPVPPQSQLLHPMTAPVFQRLQYGNLTEMYHNRNAGTHQHPEQYGSYVPPPVSNSPRVNIGNGTSVSSHSGSQSPSTSTECHSKTNLYIRLLDPTTTDKCLYDMCSRFGKIVSTKAIIDTTTNQCKGYGFVDFESEKVAEAAMKALQSEGKKVQMARQQERDDSNLYIANLPPTFSEDSLALLLEPYGPVISTRILRDHAGNCRGVGFARMNSKAKCEAAITALNGKNPPGYTERLVVKFADAANKKRRQWNDHSVSQISPRLQHMTASAEYTTSAVAQQIPVNAAMYQPQYIQLTPFHTIQPVPHYQSFDPVSCPVVYNHLTGSYDQVVTQQAPQAMSLPPSIPVMYASYPAVIDQNLLSLQMSQLQVQQAPPASNHNQAAGNDVSYSSGV